MRQSHCMSNHCISDLTSAHLLLPVRCHVIASGGSSYTRRLSRVHAWRQHRSSVRRMKAALRSLTASVSTPRAVAFPVTSSPSADMTSRHRNGGAAVETGSCSRTRLGAEGRRTAKRRYQVAIAIPEVGGASVARDSSLVGL